jgi:hypothetical protein
VRRWRRWGRWGRCQWRFFPENDDRFRYIMRNYGSLWYTTFRQTHFMGSFWF